MPREVRKALARFDAEHVPCFMPMTFMLMTFMTVTFMLMTFMTVTFMTRPAGLGYSPLIRSWAGAAGHWACHLACPIEKPCKVYTAGASGVVEQIPHCMTALVDQRMIFMQCDNAATRKASPVC
jgi:hypothetical protein